MNTESLNENQKKAVLSNAKHLRIIAGAGSGKTRVLTMHIVHLIEDEDVFPQHILAITFTNKAANEMKDRVAKMLGEGHANPFISTIHALCVRILREDIAVIGWPRNFTIVDAEDQKSIVKDAYKKYGLDGTKYATGAMLAYISANKTEEISVDRAKEMAGSDPDEKNKALVYEYYVEEQKKMYALDFDDLIVETVRLFRRYPDVAAKWQRRFRYILVDEFQDIDRMQYMLIRQLAGDDNSLLVVGDPDQTIYTWRGADVNIIMNFEKDFPDAETIILNENYRSTDMILNGANDVIRHNRHRVEKQLFTQHHSDQKITHYSAPSDEYQALWIASKVKELHDKGKSYHDMAVLYRSNYLSRSLEKGFLDERIPYIIYGGIRFYDRQEVKDALSYLRLCAGADDLAFTRVINKPKRGIGNKTLDTIRARAEQDGTSMYEAVRNHPDLFKGKTKNTIDSFVAMVESWKKWAVSPEYQLTKLLERILDQSGYRTALEESKETDRLENLKELIDDAREFTVNYPESSLDEYLQMVSLYGDHEQTNQSDFVQLMTVHAAKGLEFDTVFVSDLNEGIFPNERAMTDSVRGIEEERRLAYVAFTRAKNKLYLTDAGGFSFMLQMVRTPSRFIREIDSQWIEHLGASHAHTVLSNDRSHLQMQESDHDETFEEQMQRANVPHWKKGERVLHPKFGEGFVVKTEGGLVQIAFAYPWGVKKIAAGFPGLKKVSSLKS
ncbi:MAG: UvrD-helicase domain-containing protein [Lactimicrobium massiliense]|nr:UvrD-helicase domain-containing protein [Lactimicrobium massiliense]MDD6457669.1 UvrD-helicase domain-containing protein [Lactimicrobium massiliense]